MTAKQALHQYVDALSEDDAAVTAALLIPAKDRALRDDESRLIAKGLAEADSGDLIPLEDVERE